nr:hypothetical protein [uncultured Rhodopila sp.]
MPGTGTREAIAKIATAEVRGRRACGVGYNGTERLGNADWFGGEVLAGSAPAGASRVEAESQTGGLRKLQMCHPGM